MHPKPGVKGIVTGIAVFAAVAASAANIQLEQAYTSDVAGNAKSLSLGESFYLTAKLHVAGTLNGPYRVRFELPYKTETSSGSTYGGEARMTWGPFPSLLSQQFQVKVALLSATDQVSQPLTIQLDPKLPTSGIEFYGQSRLAGTVGADLSLATGPTKDLQWFVPVPVSAGFQTVAMSTTLGKTETSNPFGQPVAVQAGGSAALESFLTFASSSRVNPAKLRTVGFASYKDLPADIAAWLKPEKLVESDSNAFRFFAAQSLPGGFRATMRPYDAAQRLFQAVVAKMRYVADWNNADALDALRTGRGDCGAFSSLFVATLRSVGIPARTVSGMELGDNAWHVWAEFYLPGYGWIPADPAYCDGLVPDGSLPLYFGTVPELSGRVALSYGFDRMVEGHAIPMLQSPAVFAPGGTRIASFSYYCNLMRAALP